MKKRFVQLAPLFLAAALLLPNLSAHAAQVEVDPVIKVGLYYGGNAMPGANLLNSVGEGYRFGYYDADRTFYQVGETAETAISVVKAQNVWYGTVDGQAGYYDSITSDVAVGCYHIQYPGAYADYGEARTAAANIADGFVAWDAGGYTVRSGSYLSEEEAAAALAAEGAQVVGTSAYGVTVVKTGTATILFQFDGGADTSLAVSPGPDGGGEAVTWFRNRKYPGDFQYQRVGGGNITVSNVLPLEDYVRGVIVQEMSPSWPLEALKAQAVCARTYAYLKINEGKHKNQGFDICNTTDCQAYVGVSTENDNSRRAVDETYGKYVWYGGALASTVYSACDGGATEDAKNVWGGGNSPYLAGVMDPWEAQVEDKISNYHYSVTYTKAELEEKLTASGRDCTDLASVTVNPSATGNAKSVTFTATNGKSWTITGDNARIFLKTGSLRFTLTTGGAPGTAPAGEGYPVNGDKALASVSGAYAIDGSGNVNKVGGTPYVIGGDGTVAPLGGESAGTAPGGTAAASADTYTFTGTGNGHNVGMSQWGAYAMAQAGKSYEDILTFYFTGVEIK